MRLSLVCKGRVIPPVTARRMDTRSAVTRIHVAGGIQGYNWRSGTRPPKVVHRKLSTSIRPSPCSHDSNREAIDYGADSETESSADEALVRTLLLAAG